MTYEEAVDEIQLMLLMAWTPTGHKLFFESVRDQRETDNTAWAVSVIRHGTARQATLGGEGNRLFERIGIVIVQVFTPVGKGLQESYRLARVVAEAFEGRSSPGGVWFRNVGINELGKDGMFQQLNVTAEFQYHETK